MTELVEAGGGRVAWATLGVIAAMVAQAGAALVWFGAVGERIEQLEKRADLQAPVLERLARLEEAATQSQAALARIEVRLNRTGER